MIFCTYITTRGAEESNWFNYVFTVGKLFTLGFIIFVAFLYFDIDNFTPFTVPEKGGYLGTIQGASIVFFSYLGFDFITTLAEESKDPAKNLPKSISYSIVMCMLIYVLNAVALCGMTRMQLLHGATALPEAFNAVDASWVSLLGLVNPLMFRCR